MSSTPKKIPIKLSPKDLEVAEAVGFEKGLDMGRRDMLDWLEYAYLEDPGRPDRGTPKAEAILEIARAAGAHIKKLKKEKK